MAGLDQEGRTRRNALVSGATANQAEAREFTDLSGFLSQLQKHYLARSRIETAGDSSAELLSSIGLGVARLDADRLQALSPHLLPQIALLGPTQAGKSSLVNGLLGQDLAEVSPLAGFTVHPQGFCWGSGADETIQSLSVYLDPMQRVARDVLPRDRFDRYTLTEVGGMGIVSSVLDGCIWDTPDFDSVDSESYRGYLLRIAALADIVVLVLSKDKYSDQAVWDMLSLLEPIGHPAVIVLNKVDAGAGNALVESLAERWRAARADVLPFVVTVPFMDGDKIWLPYAPINDLAQYLSRHLALATRHVRRGRTHDFLQRHWSCWLSAVRAEQDACGEWRTAVDRCIDEALACYQRDYLNHPHHYQTFQRALARLLTLLEIPGVAGVVSSARRLLTWPFRQVSNLGRRVTHRTAEADVSNGELVVLEQLVEHLLLHVRQLALAKREQDSSTQAWWRDLSLMLRDMQQDFGARVRAALNAYTRSFQTEIDRTAQELYQRLETRPVVLNSLRATRITTDAAALAFALHSGGIGLQDFVIAPATLSLTSMLTESALGHFVNRAAEDLRERQLAAVSRLLREVLGESLKDLPDRLDDSRHFKLSAAAVEQAERLLADYG